MSRPKMRWVTPSGRTKTWRWWRRKPIAIVIDPSPGIDERVTIEVDENGHLWVGSNRRIPRVE